MYHELEVNNDGEPVCKHCGKGVMEWSDHPNMRECPAFKTDDPFSLKSTMTDDYDVENVKNKVLYATATSPLEDDMKAYIEWDADPVTAFDKEAWDKQNANIVRGEN